MRFFRDSWNYRAIESSLNRAVEQRWKLRKNAIDHEAVKLADKIVFVAEVKYLIPEDNWRPYEQDGFDPEYYASYHPSPTDIIPWSQGQAMASYIARHEELTLVR